MNYFFFFVGWVAYPEPLLDITFWNEWYDKITFKGQSIISEKGFEKSVIIADTKVWMCLFNSKQFDEGGVVSIGHPQSSKIWSSLLEPWQF